MKICYIADAISIHTQRLVNCFAGKGHEVHLLSWTFPKDSCSFHEKVETYHLTRLPPKTWDISKYPSGVLGLFQIQRLVNRIKPDILDAHYITVNGCLGVASGFHPLVLTAWGSDILITPRQNLIYRFLARHCLKKADLMICRAAFMKEEMEKLGADPSRIRIIFLGVDTEEFNPAKRSEELRQSLGISNSSPVVISTRALSSGYDVQTLIKAIPLVRRRISGVKFIIAGNGNQQGSLKKLANSLNIGNDVRFVGQIPRDELPGYLAFSDIYVSTSLSDGVPNSLLEAMACGLAPVVTDISANRLWVKDGENGFLFPIKDCETLAAKIACLIKNKGIRTEFAKASRKIVAERAEHEGQMEKLEKLYFSIVEGRHENDEILE